MFDIDGTLINSTNFDTDCYLKAVRTLFGIEVSPNIQDYTHATDSGILDEIISRYHIPGNRKQIHEKFKHTFYTLISEYIENNQNEVREIKGASQFIKHLQTLDNVSIAIATGGWEETAKFKLRKVNIDYSELAFASSSDHYVRSEIMRIAETKASNNTPFQSKIYFGDAIWDKEASKALNYKFVLVGNHITNDIQIDNYQHIDKILKILKL